ncbi:DUF6527 family protein [Limimaricola variabilis]|uniref:DUF6527 family protein n=1 Tax=Limimaricola variabilis TaxID=1492771 RepID=UPI002AC8DF0B|nr:DUF6527 family protein [Limimaricola variabilis]WPY94690.1 DUF6527 family protein [Limimaricola variabilis]
MTMTRAIWFRDRARFEACATPGSFRLEERETPGLFEFVYFCPCGCGVEGRLLVGAGQKPGGPRPSWRWNGSATEPSLDPSVHHRGHWHGWLRDGYWEACA